MPPPTNTEKIGELQKNCTDLASRIELLKAEVSRSIARIEHLERQIDPLRIENAILKNDVLELKKSGDAWGRRLWGLIQILIGATVGAGFTYLLKR